MTGILIVDKPADWTSHDVVAKLRGALHEKRIGHSGTLDPMATGVLVVFVGRATRAVAFAESDDKEYIAGLRLGTRTDTQDIWGNVLSENGGSVSGEELEKVLEQFRGEITQIPPMYSAVKVHGQKLYELARKGIEVERKERKILISSLEMVGREGEDFILDVTCSKGTYIRTLCNDIGEALGVGGCMSSLRRMRAGLFKESDSHSLEDILEDPANYLLPVDSLFADCPEIKLNSRQAAVIKNGGSVRADAENGKYRFYSPEGEFLMLGEVLDQKTSIIRTFYEV